MTTQASALPFNSPLETGIRSVTLLVEAHPAAFDLQRLVSFDYLVVHTGDMAGPDSLHPALPMRSAELLVRRAVVERGINLMMSRGLIERILSNSGIEYKAGEFAETFLGSLTSPYLVALRERARWVVGEYGDTSDDEFQDTITSVFDRWLSEFQSVQQSITEGP